MESVCREPTRDQHGCESGKPTSAVRSLVLGEPALPPLPGNYGSADRDRPDAPARAGEHAGCMSGSALVSDADVRRRLRLPLSIRACLFDLDGVLTQTASVHAAAWKETFDEFLRRSGGATGEAFVPFDAADDYDRYVDGGRAATACARSSPRAGSSAGRERRRRSEHPAGPQERARLRADAPRRRERVRGLGALRPRCARRRPAAAPSSRRARTAAEVLAAAGIADLFEVRVDGDVAREQGLRGKPAPDTFLAAAAALGVAAAGGGRVRGRARRRGRRARRAASGSSSASTAWAGRGAARRTAPTSSSRTSPSCWRRTA